MMLVHIFYSGLAGIHLSQKNKESKVPNTSFGWWSCGVYAGLLDVIVYFSLAAVQRWRHFMYSAAYAHFSAARSIEHLSS